MAQPMTRDEVQLVVNTAIRGLEEKFGTMMEVFTAETSAKVEEVREAAGVVVQGAAIKFDEIETRINGLIFQQNEENAKEAALDFGGFVLAFEQLYNQGVPLDPDAEDELRKAVEINIKGTKRVLDMAHKCRNLDAFIYVSTAYANCDKAEVGIGK